MDFCVSLTNPGIFYTVPMLVKLSIIENKSINDLRNKYSFVCRECNHPVEFRNRDDLIPKITNKAKILFLCKNFKPLYEDIFEIETSEIIERQWVIAHANIPKNMPSEKEKEIRKCSLRVNKSNSLESYLKKYMESKDWDNIQTKENFEEGFLYTIYASLNTEYSIDSYQYISKINEFSFLEKNKNKSKCIGFRLSFDEYLDASVFIRMAAIRSRDMKSVFNGIAKYYFILSNFLEYVADILIDDYFDLSSITSSKIKSIKRKLITHCKTCIKFAYSYLDANKLLKMLFLSTWFYSNLNNQGNIKGLNYFVNFFENHPNCCHGFNKIIYLPDRYYSIRGEKEYEEMRYHNLYFIVGYFLVKLISLPYLQSVKVQQISPESD